MRKRPAAVLLGTFVMATGSYLAWCALPCLRPMFSYDDNVPEDARQAINEWRKSSKYLRPPTGYFMKSLTNPWEMKLQRMNVKMDAMGRVQVKDFTINGDALKLENLFEPDILFEPDASGKWKGTIYDGFGSYPAN